MYLIIDIISSYLYIFHYKKKKIIILQATQYFKSPSSRYGNFNFKLYLDSSLPKKEQNIFIDEKITRSRNHYAEHIGSCFEPKLVTRARMKRRNFLRKKKKKRKTEKRVEKGRLCDGLRVYPMIGNSASEKPENLILPFARGTTRDSFPDQRTTRLSRMVGRLAVIQRRAAWKTGKQHCHRAKTLQFLIVSLKRWRRTSERESEWGRNEERRGGVSLGILRSLTLPLSRFSLSFFPSLQLSMRPTLVPTCLESGGNYYRGLIMKITRVTGIRSLFMSIALPFSGANHFSPFRASISRYRPENIRQTARILFCLAAIGVTCRANAWVGWLIDSNGDDENMCLEYLNVWGKWWSNEGTMWIIIFEFY